MDEKRDQYKDGDWKDFQDYLKIFDEFPKQIRKNIDHLSLVKDNLQTINSEIEKLKEEMDKISKFL